jgi:hypothetical protein
MPSSRRPGVEAGTNHSPTRSGRRSGKRLAQAAAAAPSRVLRAASAPAASC